MQYSMISKVFPNFLECLVFIINKKFKIAKIQTGKKERNMNLKLIYIEKFPFSVHSDFVDTRLSFLDQNHLDIFRKYPHVQITWITSGLSHHGVYHMRPKPEAELEFHRVSKSHTLVFVSSGCHNKIP